MPFGMSAFRPGAKSQLPFQGLSKLDGVLTLCVRFRQLFLAE